MLRPTALALALFLGACDGGGAEAQQLFEDQALTAVPSGVTRADAAGTISSRDADDWRVGPAYVGRVAVLQVASPNPVARAGTVSLALDVNGGVPGGLEIVLLTEDPFSGRVDFRDLVGGDCPGATGSTICSFTLSARQIDADNTGGVYRLVALDDVGIVTYGDVEVVR